MDPPKKKHQHDSVSRHADLPMFWEGLIIDHDKRLSIPITFNQGYELAL